MFDIYNLWYFVKTIFILQFNRFKSLIFTKQVSSRPFPSDVLKWMKTNSNPRMSYKLMKVCKYFQHDTFPYSVIKNINGYCYNKKERYIFDGNEFQKEDLDLFPNNLWVCEDISSINCDIRNLFSKIAVFDIKRLYLNNQDLSIADFHLLTSSKKVVSFNLINSKIKHKNGEIISFERMLECLPKVYFILIQNYVPSIHSLNALNNNAFSSISFLSLQLIDENFNFHDFFNYMIKFQKNNYSLSFRYQSPELLAAIRKVLTAWMPKYELPKIVYDGPDDEGLIKLRKKHDKARQWWLDFVNR